MSVRSHGMLGKRTCVLAIALLLVAGCGGDEGATEPPPNDITTSTSSPTSSTTSTTAPTTTTETVPFDDEVRRAAVELLEVRNDVFQNPDPERIDEYLTPLCTCYSAELAALENFVANGERWDGPAVEPLGVRLLDVDPTSPRTVVIVRQRSINIVDTSGATVREVPGFERVAFSVGLARDESGAWRINSLVDAPEFSPTLADEIVSEGLA